MTKKPRKSKKALDQGSQFATISSAMQRTYSTEQAAKAIGVHYVTVKRWLAAGLIRPSLAVPFGGHTLWRWTTADVERARKVKTALKRGPKPKERK